MTSINSHSQADKDDRSRPQNWMGFKWRKKRLRSLLSQMDESDVAAWLCWTFVDIGWQIMAYQIMVYNFQMHANFWRFFFIRKYTTKNKASYIGGKETIIRRVWEKIGIKLLRIQIWIDKNKNDVFTLKCN